MKNYVRRNFLKKMTASIGAISLAPFLSNQAKVSASVPDDQRDGIEGINDTIKTIKNLRTIHGNFNNKVIPEEQVQLVLKSCMRAANSSNMQTYSVIVIRDREKMKNVCGYQGSHLLVFCADYNRLEKLADRLGHTYYPGNTTNFVTATINTTLIAQTAIIAARSLGVDGLLTNGVHRGNMQRHWEMLDLPEKHCFPIIALVLGYPTEEPAAFKGRLDGVGVIHDEKYHTMSNEETDKMIAQYDEDDSHLKLNDAYKEQGEKHYLDWLFKRWVGRNAKPLSEETEIHKFLKKTDFIELG